MNWNEMLASLLSHLLAAVLFGALGVGLFLLALKLIVRISPFSIRKEIEEDQNVALAILIGSALIGLAVIIGQAVG